jgi:hypothetical protein
LTSCHRNKKYSGKALLVKIDMGIINLTGSQILEVKQTSSQIITIQVAPITVSFNINNGDFLEYLSKEVIVGDPYGPLPTASRVGHSFLG